MQAALARNAYGGEYDCCCKQRPRSQSPRQTRTLIVASGGACSARATAWWLVGDLSNIPECSRYFANRRAEILTPCHLGTWRHFLQVGALHSN
jgi:hypothetical protein